MKKEEIKTYALKETTNLTEVTFRNGEIKLGRFEDNAESTEMYAKNEWYFIETEANKKQVLKGNDIILIDITRRIIA